MATQEKADQGKQVGGVVKNKAYPSVSLFLGSLNMIFLLGMLTELALNLAAFVYKRGHEKISSDFCGKLTA